MALKRAPELPSELLDIIIQEFAPTHTPSGLYMTEDGFVRPPPQLLLAFSLVCRSWRAAVFPYLFARLVFCPHSLDIPIYDLLLPLKADFPHIAAVVHTLCLFADRIGVQSLCDLVDCDLLPNLRYIECEKRFEYLENRCREIHRPVHMPPAPVPGRRSLERLDLDGRTLGTSSAEIIGNTAQFLGRYATIRFIELRMPQHNLDASAQDTTTIRKVSTFPQIGELDVLSGPAYVGALFRELGVSPHLACLETRVRDSSHLAGLNDLLCAVGPTLGHLKLNLRWEWDYPVVARDGFISPRKTIVHALKQGLTACQGGLHGLQLDLDMSTVGCLYSTQSVSMRMVEECFLTAIDLTSLVLTNDGPPTRLRYLECNINNAFGHDRDESDFGLRPFAWERLRYTCRKLDGGLGLASVRVVLQPAPSRVPRRFCERRAQEMHEFAGIFARGEESRYVCEDGQCPWSKKPKEVCRVVEPRY